jgi:hypothetical protein
MTMDERFHRAEEAYRFWRAELAAGRITPAQLEAGLDSLAFEHAGRWWMLGATTGRWYASQGTSWVEATPPGPAAAPSPSGLPHGATYSPPQSASQGDPHGQAQGGHPAIYPQQGVYPQQAGYTAPAWPQPAHAAPPVHWSAAQSPPRPTLPGPLKITCGCLLALVPVLGLLGGYLTWSLAYGDGVYSTDLTTTPLVVAAFLLGLCSGTLLRWFLALPVLLVTVAWSAAGLVASHLGLGQGRDYWWWTDNLMATGLAALLGTVVGMVVGGLARSRRPGPR